MRATTIIGSVVLAGVLVGSLGAEVPASDCLPEYEKSSFKTPGFVFDESVVIKQYTYRSSHFYTHYIDDCHNFGGNICVLNMESDMMRIAVLRVALHWKEKMIVI